IGITVQKLGEAEAMAESGITDILLTYNVIGQPKAERLAHLTNFARMTVAIDNRNALESIASAAQHAASPIGLLIEFESGANRQGVQTPEQALELAKEAVKHLNIEFKGLLPFRPRQKQPSSSASRCRCSGTPGSASQLFPVADRNPPFSRTSSHQV